MKGLAKARDSLVRVMSSRTAAEGKRIGIDYYACVMSFLLHQFVRAVQSRAKDHTPSPVMVYATDCHPALHQDTVPQQLLLRVGKVGKFQEQEIGRCFG